MMRCVHVVFVFMFSLGGEHGDPDQKFVVKKHEEILKPHKSLRGFSAIKKIGIQPRRSGALLQEYVLLPFFGSPTKRCTITLLLVSNTFLCSPQTLGK